MKPFDIRQVIQERVNREALETWAKNSETLPLPRYEKQVIPKLTGGVWNMVKQMLP